MGMKISSGTSAVQGGAQAWQQRQQSFQALTQALGSGNLDAAKVAYATLSNNSASHAANNPNSLLSQLGKALQAGDLGAAQDVFAQMKSGRGHHQATSANSVSVMPTPPAIKPTDTAGSNINVLA